MADHLLSGEPVNKVWTVIRISEVEGVTIDSLAYVFSTQEKATSWVAKQEPSDRVSWVVDDFEVDEAVPR